MNISIPPQLENFVHERIEAGRYSSVSEAVRAGLRLLQKEELQYEEWVSEVRAKLAKASQGPFTEMTDEHYEDVIKRGMARLESQRTNQA